MTVMVAVLSQYRGMPGTKRPTETLSAQIEKHCEDFMRAKRFLVSVVDDDESIRESLPDLLRAFGHGAETFASAEEYLASETVDRCDCLILDIGMPGKSGPDLQKELSHRGNSTPIVFITALKDESVRLKLIAKGAVDCLFKPFSALALQRAVSTALKLPR